MDIHAKEALQYYADGCTCSQSVALAYATDLGFKKEDFYRLMEAFGGGIGGLQEVCGAFSGAAMVLSYLLSNSSEFNGNSKANTYKIIQEASDMFIKANGAIRCIDILNGHRPVHGTCGKKILSAVEIVEFIKEKYNL